MYFPNETFTAAVLAQPESALTAALADARSTDMIFPQPLTLYVSFPGVTWLQPILEALDSDGSALSSGTVVRFELLVGIAIPTGTAGKSRFLCCRVGVTALLSFAGGPTWADPTSTVTMSSYVVHAPPSDYFSYTGGGFPPDSVKDQYWDHSSDGESFILAEDRATGLGMPGVNGMSSFQNVTASGFSFAQDFVNLTEEALGDTLASGSASTASGSSTLLPGIDTSTISTEAALLSPDGSSAFVIIRGGRVGSGTTVTARVGSTAVNYGLSTGSDSAYVSGLNDAMIMLVANGIAAGHLEGAPSSGGSAGPQPMDDLTEDTVLPGPQLY